MLDLKLGFRIVAFLFLSSTCFTSLVQSVCNRDCNLAPVISRYTNTNTSNNLKHNPNTNLTTAKWIQNLNSSAINRLPDTNVTANCTCEDRSISKYNSLLLPNHLRRETLDWVSTRSGLIWSSNSYVVNSSGLAYIPGRDEDVNYLRLKTCSGLSHGAIVGMTLGVVVVVLIIARCLYIGVYRLKIGETSSAMLKNAQVQLTPAHVDKSVEFSYQELSKATYDFSLSNKIGQGGFSDVFYAELRGEKVAIKKMDMRASKEFLAELKVLTHTHHLNLVRLRGYCVRVSHFLVYEYIENGNLSQHLHDSERDPLTWSTRVQIALDSARGLEYIHEYTVPVFIHCDIKSANILIDKNFHGKVADFGLTRLTGVGSRSRLGGTFGYMPPEYVQYGDVSPKVDVFAFGVVLYELISAKKAIIRPNGADDEPKSLIALFDEVLSQADSKDVLVKLIDSRLGDNYPLDSVYKMAQLAKDCTSEDPQRRPSMRSVMVALMTLSSLKED